VRIALVTDTHLGARGDSLAFNDFFMRFWEGCFFPYLKEHGIKHVIHLGDFVDRRKFVNYVILNSWRTRIINRMVREGIGMEVIVGNHDIPYRNTNEINAVQELFNVRNIQVISKPQTRNYAGLEIAFLPWINATNYEETIRFIEETPARIAMGHLEIAGFQMDRGNICTTGISREVFKKFDTVYTGHFHHRSSDGHISYLGNTYEITWADYGDTRGFHVFDTETLDVEFIENPFRMFHKIVYDDAVETESSIEIMDFSQYNNTIVKVIMKTKNDLFLFERFMARLYEVSPLDVSIVEDFTDYSEDQDANAIINQADSTTVILDKVVDTLDIDIDKDKMKNMLRNVYHEALDQETL
jgi:DNA repair exonuclease SbcCD nuclease subunit